jgi:hypothetical protein
MTGCRTRLAGQHRAFQSAENRAVAILQADPLNRSRLNDIKKLSDVPAGEGQYRLAIGRWRFRFDVTGDVVLLTHCGLRREDTY